MSLSALPEVPADCGLAFAAPFGTDVAAAATTRGVCQVTLALRHAGRRRGVDTEAVLREAGYSAAEIAALVAAGAIGPVGDR